ncbi:hypothetical protein OT109_13370 [Phycisphaeraceae bacterium D3-23]
MISPDEYKATWDRGIKEAEADIASETPKYFWGFCGAWGERFVELFQERFGITPISKGDLRRQQDEVYEHTYNKTIEAYAAAKFGKDAIKETLDEVYAYRAEIHKQHRGLGNPDKSTSQG